MSEELRGVLNEVLLQRLTKYFNAMASTEMTEKKSKGSVSHKGKWLFFNTNSKSSENVGAFIQV